MNAQEYLDYKQRQRMQRRLIYWLVLGFVAVLLSTHVFGGVTSRNDLNPPPYADR